MNTITAMNQQARHYSPCLSTEDLIPITVFPIHFIRHRRCLIKSDMWSFHFKGPSISIPLLPVCLVCLLHLVHTLCKKPTMDPNSRKTPGCASLISLPFLSRTRCDSIFHNHSTMSSPGRTVIREGLTRPLSKMVTRRSRIIWRLKISHRPAQRWSHGPLRLARCS